jgi:hypothetical protein
MTDASNLFHSRTHTHTHAWSLAQDHVKTANCVYTTKEGLELCFSNDTNEPLSTMATGSWGPVSTAAKEMQPVRRITTTDFPRAYKR